MELFKLFGSIFVDNEKANESIHKTEEKAEGVSNKLLKGVGTAAKWGAGLLAAGTTAVGGMVALAEQTAQAADFIDKLSERTGINREELQRWKYAADQSGADVSKLEVGVKKLSMAIDGANKGSKASQEAFKALGISMKEVEKKSPSEMLDTVMKKLAEMPDSAERNALGNQLLGKSYSDMLPLLNAGAQGIDDLKNRADELGLVLSEDSIKANVAFGDTLADVKNAFGAVIQQLTTQMLPILMVFLNFILDNMPTIQAVISAVFGVINEIVKVTVDVFMKFLLPAITNLVNYFQENFPQISKTASEVLAAIKEFIELFVNAAKPVWEALWWFVSNLVETTFNSLKIIISGAIEIIKNIFKFFSSALKGDWQGMWEAIKGIVKAIWDTIIGLLGEFLNLIVQTILGIGGQLYDAGAAIFNMMWDGIKSVWTNISNWVSEKVNWLADKVMFWKDKKEEIKKDDLSGSYDEPDDKPKNPRSPNSFKKAKGGISGSHANGLSYVPFDGYIAELHEGERILTKKENKEYNKKSGDTINNFNIAKLVVREEADTKKVARELDKIQRTERRARGDVYAFN